MGESKCSKCGGTEDVGMTGDTPICARCYGVPGYDALPLQPGQVVWLTVRGIIRKIEGDKAVVGIAHHDVTAPCSILRTEPAATGQGE